MNVKIAFFVYFWMITTMKTSNGFRVTSHRTLFKTQGKINKLKLDDQYGLCYTTTTTTTATTGKSSILVKKDFMTVYQKRMNSHVMKLSYIQNKVLTYNNDKSIFYCDIEKNKELYFYEDDHIVFLSFTSPEKIIYVTLNGIIRIITIGGKTKSFYITDLVYEYFHDKKPQVQTPLLSAYIEDDRLFISNIENKVLIFSLLELELELEFIIDRNHSLNMANINVIRSLYIKKDDGVFRIYSGHQNGELKNINILYRNYAGNSSKYCFYGIFGWNHLMKAHNKPIIKIDSHDDKLITLCEGGKISIQEIKKNNQIGKNKIVSNIDIEDFDVKDNMLFVSGSIDVIHCLTVHK